MTEDAHRRAPVRHPWLCALAVALCWRLAVYATSTGLPALAPAAFPDLGAVVVNAVACLVPLAVVARLGWWRLPWLATVRPRRWWPLVPLVALYAGRLAYGWDLGPARALDVTALVLVAATSEELYSRGVDQELLRAVAPLWRAVGVGLLFGVGHALSGVVFGRDLGYVAFQVPHAVVQGFALAAARVRVVSIWPLVLVHALSNLLVLAEPAGAVPDAWEAFELAAVLVTGLLLVRAAGRDDDRPGQRAART